MSADTSTFSVGGGPLSNGATSAGLVTLYAPDVRVPLAVLLGDEPLIMGREPPRGGLVLPFSSVSRSHAKVSRQADAWQVDDLGSRNGTFVNGARIERATVVHGDELRFGEVVFKLVERGAERFLGRQNERDVPAAVAGLIGGPSMATVRAEVLRVAGAAALSVLVLGESGTGKEVVARALHVASARAGAFVAVNCAAVPAALLEAELFGAKRGAFTGLERDRLGLVRSADGGTLFLDELGDMPLEAQAKLLRVLDTRQVTPLGSHVSEPVDVRVVSATHRPIAELVDKEQFRADLYARISAHTISLPPLRERKEDIPLLVQAFLAQADAANVRVTPRFMIGLLRYDWPLNVRELLAAVRRAVALANGDALDEQHLPPGALEALAKKRSEDRALGSPRGTEEGAPKAGSRTNAPPAAELRELLQRCAGNVAAVARALGKDRAQVHRWLKHYQISLDDFRP
ncbi:MAG: sigma 54-interacting transcriptional regulator [Labilithrix sp.]|nr:sigma 54-interacting transcriptional regulator [Labilithrix sp.]MCW5812899.1 sigma 54-interacting transcriptional regulator [Labilithrix sp.]